LGESIDVRSKSRTLFKGLHKMSLAQRSTDGGVRSQSIIAPLKKRHQLVET